MTDMRQTGTDFAIGEDLYGVSVAELAERLDILREEITRIEGELTKKQGERAAAEQIFGSKP